MKKYKRIEINADDEMETIFEIAFWMNKGYKIILEDMDFILLQK